MKLVQDETPRIENNKRESSVGFKKLDRVAPLMTDPPHSSSAPFQNPPLFQISLDIITIFEPIMQYKNPFAFWM